MNPIFGSAFALSNSEADPTVKPFVGWFPPAVDGTLISLINTATPGHPERETYSIAGLAEQRFMALEILEKADVDRSHAYADWIAHEAVARGAPFGLYLRNFVLGARVLPGRDAPYGIPQLLTMVSVADAEMQTLLAKQGVAAQMPFVGIANPAIDLTQIPSVVLSNDDWERAAATLIEHAAVIVLFFLTQTPGVNEEIELLRAAGAVNRTFIVIADKDPRQAEMSNAILQLFGRAPGERREPNCDPKPAQPALEVRLPPADFPHQMRIDNDSEDWSAIETALGSLLQQARASPAREMPPLPPQALPNREVLEQAKARALREYELAQKAFEKGDGVAAEDAAIRSIAFSHWSHDRIGRAVEFMLLGSIERFRLKYPNEAVSSYFQALDLFEALLPSSDLAIEGYEPLATQLAAYLRELGDPKRAEGVLERLSVVKDWQSNNGRGSQLT